MSRKEIWNAERALLCSLAEFRGAIWLRGDRAETAIGLADTPYLALGPTEDDGSVVVMITGEGRKIAALFPAPADEAGGRS